MTVSVEVKKRIIERDDYFCLLALPGCLGEAQTAHHRANRGQGGSSTLDHPANLCAACSICNGAAEDAHPIVRTDLIQRGLRIEKDSTNERTLARAKETPIEDLQGRLWILVSATQREPYQGAGHAVLPNR